MQNVIIIAIIAKIVNGLLIRSGEHHCMDISFALPEMSENHIFNISIL